MMADNSTQVYRVEGTRRLTFYPPEPIEMTNQTKTVGMLLTPHQRQLLAKLAPDLAAKLKLDEPNARTVQFPDKELHAICKKTEAALAEDQPRTMANSLRSIRESALKALEKSAKAAPIPLANRIYQFKITLLDVDPEIWRQIQVADCTLDEFHEHIQLAMGWTNSHLHQFTIDGKTYGNPEYLDGGFMDFDVIDSTTIKISKLIPEGTKRFKFRYEYDFGDGWQHAITFERCVRAEEGVRYPRCTDGARNCPPEDIGGPYGFYDFLQAIADPNHEQHDEFEEWAGDFDPESFDAEKATKEMQDGPPDWDEEE